MVIAAALAKLVLQQASGRVLDLVTSGKLQVFGSSLVDPADKRVVGYLQARDTMGAAADAAKVVGSLVTLANPYSAPVGAAYAVGKTAFALFDTQRTAHRIEGKVDSLIEATARADQKLDGLGKSMHELGGLSRTNQTLQLLDIGITVAGLNSLTEKLADISARVSEVSAAVSAVDATLREFQESQLALAFDELRSLARALDEGWKIGGAAATRRWQDVAHRALHVQDQFETRARAMLGRPDLPYVSADPFIDAVSFANGLRVAALAACNHTGAAMSAAEDGARVLDGLTGQIGLVEISRSMLNTAGAEPGTHEFSYALAAANEAARPLERKIRQREANAITRAAPLASLERRGIRPRDWLQGIRARTGTALVFLPETDEPLNA